jgi:hypothetical protein
MKKNVLFVTAALLLLTACAAKDEKSNSNLSSAIEAGSENDQAYLEENKDELEAEMKALEEEQKKLTTLKFNKLEHFFGAIKLESENDCEFLVTNTGKKPLVIENVQASCGCTTPQKPEKPIEPGKSDVIKVHFKPSSEGKGVEKTVTVTANTEPRINVLKIKADVSK